VQDASLRSRGTRSDIAHEQGHLGQARRPGWFSNFFFDLGSLGTLEPKGAQGGLEEADRNNRLGSYQGNRTSVSDSFGLNFHSTPTSSFQLSILRTIPDGGSLSKIFNSTRAFIRTCVWILHHWSDQVQGTDKAHYPIFFYWHFDHGTGHPRLYPAPFCHTDAIWGDYFSHV